MSQVIMASAASALAQAVARPGGRSRCRGRHLGWFGFTSWSGAQERWCETRGRVRFDLCLRQPATTGGRAAKNSPVCEVPGAWNL